jgi:hypothetical protein
MASQTPRERPQGVWPREQRRKPADGSESYWSPGYSLAGTFGKLEGTVAVVRGDRLTNAS